MRVLIAHNEVPAGASEADRDTLVQVAAVEETLRGLGHEVSRLACGLDLDRCRCELAAARPDRVFNLVESLGGSDRLQCLLPMLLELSGIPYTGSPADMLALTGNKLWAKQRLREAGLPTPDWEVAHPSSPWCPPASGTAGRAADGAAAGTYIVKAVFEHASFGLNDDAIATCADRQELRARIAAAARLCGRACFSERYIAGREFNLSLLAAPEAGGRMTGEHRRVDVLPAAEIDFTAFADGKPRVVGYRAKWDAGSFEYRHTPRRFDFPPEDCGLLAQLGELARACWQCFHLRGYARVDFRVDDRGRPWILEVNANPCLSPDAGFAAALARARIGYGAALQRILDDAVPEGTQPREEGMCP